MAARITNSSASTTSRIEHHVYIITQKFIFSNHIVFIIYPSFYFTFTLLFTTASISNVCPRSRPIFSDDINLIDYTNLLLYITIAITFSYLLIVLIIYIICTLYFYLLNFFLTRHFQPMQSTCHWLFYYIILLYRFIFSILVDLKISFFFPYFFLLF